MRQYLVRLLPKTRFARRLALLASTTALGQGVMVLAMPLLTRLYTPEDYGAFVVVNMLLGLATFATGLRYEAAIPLCRSDADAAAVSWLVLAIAAAVGLTMLPLLAAGGPWLAAVLGFARQEGLFWWLPLVLFLQGAFAAFNGWALYRGSMRDLALSKVAQWTTMAAVQVALGFLTGGNPHALLVGLAAGQAASVAPILLHLSPAQRRLFLRPGLGRMGRLAVRFRRFPMFGSWALLLNNAAVMLPAPLIAAIFGPALAGLYGLAQRVMGVPIRFVGISAGQVYTAEIAQLAHEDRAKLAAVFTETVWRLFLMGALYLGLIALIGSLLFATVFGEAWRGSGDLARFLAPMYLAMFINQPVQYTLQYFERQDLALFVNGYSLLVVLTCFGLAEIGFLDGQETILLMSLGLTVAYTTSFFLARLLILGRLSSGRRTGILAERIDEASASRE